MPENEGSRCASCGTQVEPHQVVCPHCGNALRKTPKVWPVVLWAVLLAIVGIPALLMGGCFLVLSIGSNSDPKLLLAGLAGLGVFAGVVWGLILAVRLRRH